MNFFCASCEVFNSQKFTNNYNAVDFFLPSLLESEKKYLFYLFVIFYLTVLGRVT